MRDFLKDPLNLIALAIAVNGVGIVSLITLMQWLDSRPVRPQPPVDFELDWKRMANPPATPQEK